jgi:shikimate kinase
MAKKNEKNNLEALGNVYLAGFMCAGKTSAGRLLAKRLGRRFADSDALAEKRSGRSVTELVKARGLGGFRRLEAGIVKELAAKKGLVVALGGGVYPSRRWRGLLERTGVTVFLLCAWPELERRLSKAAAPRPLLAGPLAASLARAKKLYSRRLPFYRRAKISVDVTRAAPAKAAELIRKKL